MSSSGGAVCVGGSNVDVRMWLRDRVEQCRQKSRGGMCGRCGGSFRTDCQRHVGHRGGGRAAGRDERSRRFCDLSLRRDGDGLTIPPSPVGGKMPLRREGPLFRLGLAAFGSILTDRRRGAIPQERLDRRTMMSVFRAPLFRVMSRRLRRPLAGPLLPCVQPKLQPLSRPPLGVRTCRVCPQVLHPSDAAAALCMLTDMSFVTSHCSSTAATGLSDRLLRCRYKRRSTRGEHLTAS